MRNSFGNWFADHTLKNDKSILLSGDIGYRIFDRLREQNEQKFINCGIAEQNMIGTAAGLASKEFSPWVYTIVPFLIYRPYEFVRNLIAFQNLNVKLVGVGSGLAYDTLGFTHYGLEDISLTKNLPNMRILLPYDAPSAIKCFEKASDTNGPCYIRLLKGGEPVVPVEEKHEGYDIIKNCGNDVSIVCHGGIIHNYIGIPDRLAKQGIKCQLIAVWDSKAVVKLHKFFGKKTTLFIEEHFSGGLFEGYRHVENVHLKVIRDDTLGFFHTREKLLSINGLLEDQICREINELNHTSKII
jgi:transketolase